MRGAGVTLLAASLLAAPLAAPSASFPAAGPAWLSAAALAQPAKDQAKDGKGKGADKDSPLGALGGGSKEPIKIDADRLDVFDKENKAIFAGNVVAVQGDATIRCSALTVHYNRSKKDEKKGDDEAGGKTTADLAENGIRKVECAGPVTVKQKDQVATGDNATFDQVARRIEIIGNVVLSQCQNVTRGSRLVYDMDSGRANMDPGKTGRVSALFVPGEKTDGAPKGGSKGCATPPVAAKPKPAEAAEAEPAADKAAAKPPAKPAPKTRAQAN